MNFKYIIFALTLLGTQIHMYAQGAFGELSLNGTYYTAVEEGFIGNTANVLTLGAFSYSNENAALSQYDERYSPTVETMPVRFGATYSRYFALSNNTYLSMGLGYSNYKNTMTFLDREIENKYVQQHYLTFPVRFHLLSNKVRKQNPYSEQINTSHILQHLKGGIEISVGARIHTPLAAKKDIQSSDQDFAKNLNRVMGNLQTGFPTIGIEPEFALSVGAGAGITFNFILGYLLNPPFKNMVFDTYESGGDRFGLQSYYENNIQVSFSVSFRGGYKKAYP